MASWNTASWNTASWNTASIWPQHVQPTAFRNRVRTPRATTPLDEHPQRAGRRRRSPHPYRRATRSEADTSCTEAGTEGAEVLGCVAVLLLRHSADLRTFDGLSRPSRPHTATEPGGRTVRHSRTASVAHATAPRNGTQ